MPITGKKVVAAVNNAWVSIEWYGSDDRLIFTVNGQIYQFALWAPGTEGDSREDTIAALKEAAAEL